MYFKPIIYISSSMSRFIKGAWHVKKYTDNNKWLIKLPVAPKPWE